MSRQPLQPQYPPYLRRILWNAGGTAKLTVTGDGLPITGTTVTYSSADPSVADVDLEGIVTGVAIGRTTVTVTADYGAEGSKTTSVEVPVVGENLMTRQGVKHGEFQNAVYLNDQPGGAETQKTTLPRAR